MCKDVRSSLAAGSFSWLAAAVLWRSGQPRWRWLGAFIATFSSVQFVDAAVWASGPSSQTAMVLVRFVLPLVLAAEPLVNYWGYLRTVGKRLVWFEAALAVMVVYMLATWVRGCGTTTVTRDGWLKWCGTDVGALGKIAFLLALVVPLLFFPDPAVRAVIVAGGVLAWALNFRNEAWGSRWCHLSNALSLAALVAYAAGR